MPLGPLVCIWDGLETAGGCAPRPLASVGRKHAEKDLVVRRGGLRCADIVAMCLCNCGGRGVAMPAVGMYAGVSGMRGVWGCERMQVRSCPHPEQFSVSPPKNVSSDVRYARTDGHTYIPAYIHTDTRCLFSFRYVVKGDFSLGGLFFFATDFSFLWRRGFQIPKRSRCGRGGNVFLVRRERRRVGVSPGVG